MNKWGIVCIDELPGRNEDGKKWVADTYFEFEGRKIVIEIQHSYQSFNNYLKRQSIYISSGIECYWLLYPERFGTLLKAPD